ncbi:MULTISPECIES: hypothetical protein [unclassified Microbacterium]|uniref:hypothetical protein n=1 Tax=unclassified Microbacterium TaxID=2609290 RepID=UPI0016054384|nr:MULTISPECIES: hypothetical protein [unclassified Microbacterium]QNA92764.1 hypothetical protein G4G29_11005 [Microbacterium sp. Se63.02b]QYM62908.1 hypothetical protein K1X59_11045 [Microbacterium sp. Se5.02b]
MKDVMAWATVIGVLAMGPALLIVGLTHTFSRKPVEKKYEHVANGGLVGVFDSVWSPTAHEASQERDRQTQRTAPAPAPGDPPNRIDAGRIVIDV